MHECVECGDVITNPVSERRLALQFRTWLAETDPALEEKFANEYISREDFIPEDDNRCVLTGHKMDLCPYCATAQFVDWLHNQTVSPKLLEWALDFFVARRDEKHLLNGLRTGRRGVRITLDQATASREESVVL